jgi:uncharacterized Tic20 family protein
VIRKYKGNVMSEETESSETTEATETIESDGTIGKEARTWGMACHLISLCGFIIPFGSILGPLIIWVIKKNDDPFIDDQGKESINFQITVLIAFIVSAILTLVLIGFLLMFVVGIYALVMIIIASMKANEGIAYRYPYSIRLIK